MQTLGVPVLPDLHRRPLIGGRFQVPVSRTGHPGVTDRSVPGLPVERQDADTG